MRSDIAGTAKPQTTQATPRQLISLPMVAGLKPRALTRKVGVKEISTMNQVTNTQLIRVQSRMLRLFSSARRLRFRFFCARRRALRAGRVGTHMAPDQPGDQQARQQRDDEGVTPAEGFGQGHQQRRADHRAEQAGRRAPVADPC